MNNLNSILIEGNLVRDPELSYTPKGTAVCKFSVACNRYYKQDQETQKEVSYFDVSTWTRLAEVCGEYLKKGRGVRVVGRLKQDRWSDAEGKAHSRVEIVAEHVEFKPQLRKNGADGDNGEEKSEDSGAETAVREEEELKEAASF
ncbi:MAG TPA: single-stranded DNA-binding protein [Spirochaetia bacterium]|nr:single-stranded DNA-binding protein [Spirochaetia bacterium]